MSELPIIAPMLATNGAVPFDESDWLFELKHDGFRALAYVEKGNCRLVSRRGAHFGRFSRFKDLQDAICSTLKDRSAILDGEIVCLDKQGRSVFAAMFGRRPDTYFYAFDLLWLEGTDFRPKRLVERKVALLCLIGRGKGRLRYVHHVRDGRALFRKACEWDLEGIVAKRANSVYLASRTKSWRKIKNPNYSQAEGRKELFDRWRAAR